MPSFATACDKLWYERHPAALVLAPLGMVYAGVARGRRALYRTGFLSSHVAEVPVIVVGNLTVGGTGKTPLTIWLANFLRGQLGCRPGIVTRGYLGRARHWPQQVRPDSDPDAVGDEAVIIARRTACPVAAAPDRVAAVDALLQYSDVDVVISDDGLQHYRLAATVEIAVVDGVRRFGNGMCLPAGPLREPAGRLNGVDLIVTNGLAARGEFAMRYVPRGLVPVGHAAPTVAVDELSPRRVHAVAGVGNPKRFFDFLKGLGFDVVPHPFPDHHRFSAEELEFADGLPIVMTEKDAVKCESFRLHNAWSLPIDADLPEAFGRRIEKLLKEAAVAGD